MRIIFVRHGHPNYENDCLTALGHRQAEAAALRLLDEPINAIFSSTCGRALETAEHIAKSHGLTIEKCDFMRELSWGSVTGEKLPFDGHPWLTADNMVSNAMDLTDGNWSQHPPFCNNRVVENVQSTTDAFDKWLVAFGYQRKGDYYQVLKCNSETVVMASHAGSSSAVIAHLIGLTFPFYCAKIKPDFTAITVIEFNGNDCELISPTVEILNDARHIKTVI